MDVVLDDGVHVDSDTVLGENLLRGHVKRTSPQVDLDHRLKTRVDKVDSWVHHLCLLHPAELENDGALILLHHHYTLDHDEGEEHDDEEGGGEDEAALEAAPPEDSLPSIISSRMIC